MLSRRMSSPSLRIHHAADTNTCLRGSIETPLMHKRNALEGVEPGYTETPINRLGTAEECGNLIAWLLSDESTFISGATYSIDGGWAC